MPIHGAEWKAETEANALRGEAAAAAGCGRSSQERASRVANSAKALAPRAEGTFRELVMQNREGKCKFVLGFFSREELRWVFRGFRGFRYVGSVAFFFGIVIKMYVCCFLRNVKLRKAFPFFV